MLNYQRVYQWYHMVSHHIGIIWYPIISAPKNPHQPAPAGENGEADWVQLGDKSHEQGPGAQLPATAGWLRNGFGF
jgi:hypothetical protein